MLKKSFRDGFTLVELSFSLLFIGILSIIVVLIINNTVVAYRRGLLLGQINNNGTELVDDMRSALQNSSSRSLVEGCKIYDADYKSWCIIDGGYHLAFSEKTAKVSLNGGEEVERPIYGVFCAGSYSYIWNSGYFEYEGAEFEGKEDNEGRAMLTYTTSDGTSQTVGKKNDDPFRLLKVRDEDRKICKAALDNRYFYSAPSGGDEEYETIAVMRNNDIHIEVDSEPEMEELLADGDSNTLALYNLFLARPENSIDGQNMFYYAYFVLGTITNGANVTASGNTCVAPKEEESGSIDYCAINKFNFAAQVNGGYR